ncbi:MAG: hypothetical protein R3F01_00185 [Lysobacteraceae bacterium]
MPTRRIYLVLAGVLLLVVVGISLRQFLDRSAEAITPGAVTTNRADSLTISKPDVEIESPVESASLEIPTPLADRPTSATVPPQPEDQTDDRPFDVRILEYKELADAGDADAACRLIRALDKCSSILGSRFHDDDSLIRLLANAELDEATLRESSAKLASTLSRGRQLYRECQRVPEQSLQTKMPYLLDLAKQGNEAAMLRFIQGPSTAEMVLNQESIDLYRQHVNDVFLRAFDQGIPEVALVWANAMEYPGTSLAAKIPAGWEDRDVAFALRQQMEELAGVSSRYQRSEPTPDVAARADALFQRYFANSMAMDRWTQQQQERKADMAAFTVDAVDFIDRLNKSYLEEDECRLGGKYGHL